MPSGLIKSYAKQSGKSKKEVESIWNSVKSSVEKEGIVESDPRFYRYVVGRLKKSLKLESKSPIFIERFKEFLKDDEINETIIEKS